MIGGPGWRSKGCRYIHGDTAAAGMEGSVAAKRAPGPIHHGSLFLCRTVASLIPCFSVFSLQCLLSQAWSLCGAALCHAHLLSVPAHFSGKPQKGKLGSLRGWVYELPMWKGQLRCTPCHRTCRNSSDGDRPGWQNASIWKREKSPLYRQYTKNHIQGENTS